MGRIRDNQPIKTKLAAQKICQQFGRQRCRHQLFILDSWAQSLAVGGQPDMANHKALDTGVDQRSVHLPKRGIPLFTGQIVVAG